MAKVAQAFSPKEWSCWVISDATNSGDTGIHTSNMLQLDVDSIGFPSLNVTQALDVRNGVGATLKDEDFFQDNKMRVVELSLSGTLHDDTGHRLLLANICGAAQADDTNQTIAHNHKIVSHNYGAAVTNNASSLTIALRPSDISNQTTLEMSGMVVTNFVISSDSGTEGGRYKWSATLQSGYLPDLDDTTLAGASGYVNTDTAILSASSGHKVINTDVIMSSFTCTIDYPAVFTGATSTGFETVSRGAECAVTVDTQVKYDDNTKGFVNSFDTQTAATNGNTFVVVNNGKFGLEASDGILTNVAYSEGDIMMLDCSLKAVSDGSSDLITIDLSD